LVHLLFARSLCPACLLPQSHSHTQSSMAEALIITKLNLKVDLCYFVYRYFLHHCSYKKYMQYANNATMRGVRVIFVAVEKLPYSECVSVALVIQLAKSMRRIIVSSVACMVLSYLYTLSHKLHIFSEKKLSNKKCVLIFSTTFV
jgi:hypothetical protein